MREKKLMIKQVALSTKPPMNPASLSRMLRQNRSQSLDTVQRIAKALGCEPVLFLRDGDHSDYQI